MALKLFPCCYALQRPIEAVRSLSPVNAVDVRAVTVRTLAATVKPLIHDWPRTGPEGKFSLQYGVAATLLDGRPGLASFTDEAVLRPEAQDLIRRVDVVLDPGGHGLLDGSTQVQAETTTGLLTGKLSDFPGSPTAPPSTEQLDEKVRNCLEWAGIDPATSWDWSTAADVVREALA